MSLTQKTFLSLFCLVILNMGCSRHEGSGQVPNDTDPGYQGVKSLCQVAPVDDQSSMAFLQKHNLIEALSNQGIQGWIHGSLPEQGLFVFTWRNPENFFENIQLPIQSEDEQWLESLSQLNRHDRVMIKGELMAPGAPLPHIKITHLEVTQPYQGPAQEMGHTKELGPLPPEILQGNEIVAQVHISVDGGRVIVIEKEGRMIPVFNRRPDLARQLYRNDKIFLKYIVRQAPNHPVHLEVDITRSNPIEVVSQIACRHGQSIELSGELVMFPQSPQINRNIFALRTRDPEGIIQNYTFITANLHTEQGIQDFIEINNYLQNEWDRQSDFAVYDGNKYINPRLRVRAKGLKNLTSPFQANPQIIVDELEVNWVWVPSSN
jgi:hypothetical protein